MQKATFRSISELLASARVGQKVARDADFSSSQLPVRDCLRTAGNFEFDKVIDEICELPWQDTNENEILRVALAYYYFSVQFRENLEAACRLHPGDDLLQKLHREECNTGNLSPWENIAEPGESMNHDEFMRRLIALQPMRRVSAIERNGSRYLRLVRATNDHVRAKSIASYEDGGLARVFNAILRAPRWDGAGQRAFRHFLEKHVAFDSCSAGGHGALSRHLLVDDSILPLWTAFKDLLRSAVPSFESGRTTRRASRLATLAEPQ